MPNATIAVIAAGAMGAATGARLTASGATVLTDLDGRSEGTIARAHEAGMQHAALDALARADTILSIVPPDQAVPLATRLAGAVRSAGATPLYVDCNAINPATAREVGRALDGSGARYVDGSIIGPPPKPGSTTPIYYVSGPDAAAAEALIEHGLSIKRLGGGIGAASALKMSYAGMTKGILALGTAMILAAEREGAADALRAELQDSQSELLKRFGRGLPDMLPKAYRWVPEMKEIAGFIGSDDPASGIYGAIAALYEQVADDQKGDGTLGRELLAFFA